MSLCPELRGRVDSAFIPARGGYPTLMARTLDVSEASPSELWSGHTPQRMVRVARFPFASYRMLFLDCHCGTLLYVFPVSGPCPPHFLLAIWPSSTT